MKNTRLTSLMTETENSQTVGGLMMLLAAVVAQEQNDPVAAARRTAPAKLVGAKYRSNRAVKNVA